MGGHDVPQFPAPGVERVSNWRQTYEAPDPSWYEAVISVDGHQFNIRNSSPGWYLHIAALHPHYRHIGMADWNRWQDVADQCRAWIRKNHPALTP